MGYKPCNCKVRRICLYRITMDIEYLFNQPIQLYKVNPTTAELNDGFTSWENTAYHKRLGNCFFIGPEYCHPVLNTDYMTFQFKASTTGSNLITPFLTPISAGATTSTTADKLNDTGADFTTDGVLANMLVLNTTELTSTFVTAVDSSTVLSIEDDLFLSFPEDYEILPILATGNFRYNQTTDDFYVSAAAASTITFDAALTIGLWYRIDLEVTDITAGSFTIKLGDNIIATISTVGTHTVYGECQTNTDFVITASSTFVGSIDSSISALQLVTDYNLVLFDAETELYVAYAALDATGTLEDSLTIGNVFVSTQWYHIAPDCGNYILGLTDGTICDGNMVRGGGMSSNDFWTLDPGITIGGGKLNFSSVSAGNVALNNGGCTIQEGQSYDVLFTISSNGGTMVGNFSLIIGDFVVYSHDAATMADPTTVSFSGVALGDSNYTSFVADDTCTFSIDNYSVSVTPTAIYSDMDGLSECYCVCDTQDCTVVVEYTADQPTFGEFFDSNNYKMRMRVPGRLRNDTTPTLDFDPFKSTLDNQVQPYNNLNRAEELATQFMPAWAHNSLAVILMHPIVYLDTVLYVCTGVHTPNWGDSELAEGNSKVMKKNQGNLRNTY